MVQASVAVMHLMEKSCIFLAARLLRKARMVMESAQEPEVQNLVEIYLSTKLLYGQQEKKLFL